MEEFEINLSETENKEIPPHRFKILVKNKAIKAGIKYLNSLQNKKEKGAKIRYESLELMDYLNSWSNIRIEDQRFIFSIRSEITR